MFISCQDGEAQDPREAADERVHGVGAGGAEEARRPVPQSAQRGAQQDARETVAVSAEFGLAFASLRFWSFRFSGKMAVAST